MKFHEKLYTLRKGANMTQTELAEKLGVSRQAVSRWEMGTAMPDIDNLIAMSDLFDVTLDDLLKEQTKQLQSGAEEEDQEQEQDSDDPSFNRMVNWMRVDMILIVGGIAVIINGAFLSSMFRLPFASLLSKIGIGMLILAIPLTIILVAAVIRYKKTHE